MGASQPIPKLWNKFLSVGSNKENLLAFLCNEWQQHIPTDLLNDITLYVTTRDKCIRLSPSTTAAGGVCVNVMPLLFSDHEEADTRLLFHAMNAVQNGATNLLIVSPDTDVAILAIAHAATLSVPVSVSLGREGRARIINASAVASCLGSQTCAAILGLHALTGCDSTSAFYGKGKKKCFQRMLEDEDMKEVLGKLGVDFLPPATVLENTEAVVCKLYGSSYSNISDARYAAFCGNSSERALPPSKPCLQQHIRRAAYQSAIWRRALSSQIAAPSPDGNGWKIQGTGIRIVWSNEPPAPKDVLPLVHCRCAKLGCISNRCSCVQAAVPCIDMCGCTSLCKNTVADEGMLGGSMLYSDRDSDSGSESD